MGEKIKLSIVRDEMVNDEFNLFREGWVTPILEKQKAPQIAEYIVKNYYKIAETIFNSDQAGTGARNYDLDFLVEFYDRENLIHCIVRKFADAHRG